MSDFKSLYKIKIGLQHISSKLDELEKDFHNLFAMLNLNNAGVNVGHTLAFSQGRQLIEQHFKHPGVNDPRPAHDSVAFVCEHSAFVSITDLAVDDYSLLPTKVNGPAPTLVNLSADNQFELVAFKLVDVTQTHAAFRRTTTINDNGTALSAPVNAANTFGSVENKLYYQIPAAVAGQNPPQFLRATNSLRDQLRDNDPSLNPPVPAAVAAAPGQIPPAPLVPNQHNALEQLVQGQQKLTMRKVTMYQRYSTLEKIFSTPGKFQSSLLNLMFGLPGGQAPSAAFFSGYNFSRTLRELWADYSQHLPERSVTISESDLEELLLLHFNSPAGVSFAQLATPQDLPLTFLNIQAFMTRVGDTFSVVYGPDLPMAISATVDQLVQMHQLKDVLTLTPTDILRLIERKLAVIDRDPRFVVTPPPQPPQPPNGRSVLENLTDYLSFTPQDTALVRLQNSRLASEQDNAADPQSVKRKRTSAHAAAAASAPTTRAKAAAGGTSAPAQQVSLTAWHDKLRVDCPALAGVKKLPCLYFLANKAPCFQLAACQKATQKVTHNVPQLVKDNDAAIQKWLLEDPLGRFK